MDTVKTQVNNLIQIKVKTETPPVPDNMRIEPSALCCFKCKICPSSLNLREKGLMTMETLEIILDRIKPHNIKRFGFVGLGEPLLNGNIFEMIQKASRVVPYIFLTTGGSLAEPNVIRKLHKIGVASLKFSINATTKEEYHEMTGKDCFDKTMQNLLYAHWYAYQQEKEMTVSASMVINKEPTIKQRQFMASLPHRMQEDLYYIPQHNHAGTLDIESNGCKGTYGTNFPPVPCRMLFNSMDIDWKGRMNLCSIDHKEKFIAADLKTQTIEDGWYSDLAKSLRKKHLEGNIENLPCEKCVCQK